jgi:hypothetical protein
VLEFHLIIWDVRTWITRSGFEWHWKLATNQYSPNHYIINVARFHFNLVNRAPPACLSIFHWPFLERLPDAQIIAFTQSWYIQQYMCHTCVISCVISIPRKEKKVKGWYFKQWLPYSNEAVTLPLIVSDAEIDQSSLQHGRRKEREKEREKQLDIFLHRGNLV